MNAKLLIIFTVYFFLTSIGIVYTTHSCGKKISNTLWGINVSGYPKCLCNHDTDKHSKDDCCKDELLVIKAKTDSPTHHTLLQFSKPDVSLLIFRALSCRMELEGYNGVFAFQINRPPPLPHHPLFLRYRALLI